MDGLLFSYNIIEVIALNISNFIKEHKELNELPFLVVFRTMTVLKEYGVLDLAGEDENVETAQ